MTWERFNLKYAPARIKLKQLARACGHSGIGSELDPADLIGTSCRGIVAPRTYEDKDTHEMVETTQIKKFIYDAEEVEV